ncbi:MAG: glycosyltransferase [Bacteroidota bacterium]
MPKYSFVVPVYNRPHEVAELLSSLTLQEVDDFEVIVVEDGSENDCEPIIDVYRDKLALKYFRIPNSGPGRARNYGASQASGDWFIFLDSDTLIPNNYLVSIETFLRENEVDAFGGADRDRNDFLPIQKAISYSMTSFLTTGGIRGSKRSMEKFKPRSFNMGIKKIVFEHLNGYGKMRYGEDIDLSIRIENLCFKTAYIPDAFVYHKRRTSFWEFFKQIKHSGEARILLSQIHKGSLKLVHLFPGIFTVGFVVSLIFILLLPTFGSIGFVIYSCYFLLILIHSSLKTRSIKIGCLASIASFIQLIAYGYGFLKYGTIAFMKGLS